MTSIFRRPTKCFGCLASTVCKKIWISIHNEFRGPESLFSCSNGQEIRFHLSHLKVYRSPSLDPIPRQLNPVHNFASYFFLIINLQEHYYPTWYYPPIYVEVCWMFPSLLFFSTKFVCTFLISSCMLHVPPIWSSILLPQWYLVMSKNRFWERYSIEN